MLTSGWLRAVKASEEDWSGRVCGIAYTHTFFRDPEEIWYDRLATDVPAYIAGGLAKIGADPLYLNVEQVIELCLQPEKRDKVSAIFNVCLGHKSLDNWALVPAVAAWAGLPVLPNGAHVTVLGEDKRVAKDFARRAGLSTAEDWSDRTGESRLFVRKPIGWGSSVGLQLLEGRGADEPGSIVEPFVPGYDLTVTMLHDPSRRRLAAVGALCADHGSEDALGTMWTKEKKSGGSQSADLNRTFHEIGGSLEEALDAFAADLGLRSAARFDFRINALPAARPIEARDVVFLEVNPCPTPSAVSSFGRTIRHAVEASDNHGVYTADSSDAFAVSALLSSVSAR